MLLSKNDKLFFKIMSNYRKNHIIKICENFDIEHLKVNNNIPLDLHLRKYFLSYKSISNIDREFISDQVYNLMRFKGLIDFLTPHNLNWLNRFETFYSETFEKQFNNINLPKYHYT